MDFRLLSGFSWRVFRNVSEIGNNSVSLNNHCNDKLDVVQGSRTIAS